MGKSLTPELIVQRSKTDNFEKIKNLNLWGNELDDVSILRELPNVEVLSLSVNKISSLKDFAHSKKLTELYLRKNGISDLTEIKYLKHLEFLRVLWLWDNPCAEHQYYRQYVIKTLPNLVKLDNTTISQDERDVAMMMNIDLGDEGKGGAQPPTQAPYHKAKVGNEYPPHANPEPAKPIRKQPLGAVPKIPENRNENILCAIMALLKELDINGLELVRRDLERKITSYKKM